jgi:hypothetical protein
MAVSLKENNWFFITDQTPRPYLTRSLPPGPWALFPKMFLRLGFKILDFHAAADA